MSAGNTWDRVEGLFDQVLAPPQESRVDWVHAQCGTNADARDQVLALLGAVILVQSHSTVQHSETRILAALDHPHIARLIDAGATPLGFRFLPMEYVED